MKLKALLPDAVAIVAFVLLSFAYFFPADLEGRILFQHDTSAAVGAGREAVEYHEATGHNTRWTNSIFGGMPTYQMIPSYDSTRPLSWVQAVWRLWLPDYVQLAFILILGFYVLMRAFGLPVWLSALGGLAWAFSSYFFILISAGHLWKFITLAYIPPTLAGMVLAYRGKVLWGAVLTAVFVALQVAANHVQMTYYFLMVILFLFIAYGVELGRAGRIGTFVRTSAVLLVAALLGVAANLSNLYHTYTYSQQTMRGPSELTQEGEAGEQGSSGLDRDYITAWSYGVGETWTLLVPNHSGGSSSATLSGSSAAMSKADPRYLSLYGQFAQYFGEQPWTAGPVYVGAFVLLLFVLGCLLVRGPVKWALLAATLLSVMLAWGKNFMPLTDWFIDHVPLYNKFRAVSSILVVAEFTIPALAMLGLWEVVKRPELLTRRVLGGTAKKGRGLPVIGLALALTALPALLMALFPGWFHDSFLTTTELAAIGKAVDGGGIPASELGGLINSITDSRKALVSADAWRSLIVIVLGTALLWAYVRQRKTDGARQSLLYPILIIIVCLVDLWTVNKRYLNDSQFVSPSQKTSSFTQTTADRIILSDTTTYYRVLNFSAEAFNENNTAYWHKSVGGYHAAKLRRYQEMIDYHIGPEMSALYRALSAVEGDMSQVPASVSPVLNMLNTRYFLFAGQGGDVPVRNPHALGNAWFVDSVCYVADADAEIEEIDYMVPTQTAVVDRRFADALGQMETGYKDSLSRLSLTAYAPNRLVFASDNAGEGVAVFSDIYYPDGWQVDIDGEPAPLARANYVLRCLRVPAGHHTITMSFDPVSLHTTEAVAYVALALMALAIVAAVVDSLRRRKKAEPTRSGGA